MVKTTQRQSIKSNRNQVLIAILILIIAAPIWFVAAVVSGLGGTDSDPAEIIGQVALGVSALSLAFIVWRGLLYVVSKISK